MAWIWNLRNTSLDILTKLVLYPVDVSAQIQRAAGLHTFAYPNSAILSPSSNLTDCVHLCGWYHWGERKCRDAYPWMTALKHVLDLTGRFLFRSGNQEHPGDKIENTTVEILPVSVWKHPHTSATFLWCGVWMSLIRLYRMAALRDVGYWLLTGMWVWQNCILFQRWFILTLWATLWELLPGCFWMQLKWEVIKIIRWVFYFISFRCPSVVVLLY